MTKQASKRKPDPLGRLKSFGLKEPWQVALLLPTGWDDLTCPIEDFGRPARTGDQCVVVGRLDGMPEVRFGNGAPRLIGYLSDQNGRKLGFFHVWRYKGIPGSAHGEL